MPAFRQALEAGRPIEPTRARFEIPIGRKTVPGTSLRSTLPGEPVPVYLVHQPQYYDRPKLYRESSKDYKENCEPFVFFCRATLEAIRQLDLGTELPEERYRVCRHAHHGGPAICTRNLTPAAIKPATKRNSAALGSGIATKARSSRFTDTSLLIVSSKRSMNSPFGA